MIKDNNEIASEKVFEKLLRDQRISPVHISLFTGIVYCWQQNQFQNPTSVSRRKLMNLSHIKGYATYHKCIKELEAFGYFRYVPSYNPFLGSLIYMN